MADPRLEAKVKAATGGSAAGVALAGLILFVLDTYVFTDQPIPDAVSFAVVTLLPIGLTFAGGYLARHTPRPDPAAVAERLAPPSNVNLLPSPDRAGTWTTRGYQGVGDPPPPLT